MQNDLAQKAISAALKANWNAALELNKQILKNDSKDVDALNRLARAHSELGEIAKAKKIAQKVVKIDPHNTIAAKALERWKVLKKGEKAVPTKFSARVFLEEPGKTKIVSLLHLGDSNKVLANLDSGDEVVLKLGSHRISVCTLNKKYIGRLPDDLSVSLIKLIKRGNEYQVFVKSSKPHEIKVFIRETKRTKELESIPSFSSEKINYISFTPPELVHKKQTIKETGEDDED
jgi:tetratricopeptide (TPR) repeat protein